MDIDDFVARLLRVDAETGSVRVARDELPTYDSAALCVLWPAIAARAGVTLDRRGTLRLSQFTTAGTPGSRIQVSGGVEVYRHRDETGDGFVFRRMAGHTRPDIRLPLTGVVDLGAWRFRPAPSPDIESADERTAEQSDRAGVGSRGAWSAELPGDCQLTVRAWRPGDRMRVATSGSARRVKRFFSDARIPSPMRAGWPVVLAGDEIVWIPGVRGVRVVPERSGRPVIRYTCEWFDSGLAYNG
jgi:tRNA(Ile)-lysidine synthetase-like protein